MKKFFSEKAGLPLEKGCSHANRKPFRTTQRTPVRPLWLHGSLILVTSILVLWRKNQNERHWMTGSGCWQDDCRENHRTFLFPILLPYPSSLLHLCEICHYFPAQISHVNKKLELLYKHWSYRARQLARSYKSMQSLLAFYCRTAHSWRPCHKVDHWKANYIFPQEQCYN